MNTAVVKILLVEDSASDADVLQEMLHQSSLGRFEFTRVERLDQAVARLRQETFDVLLLDLSLPDSTGSDTFLCARDAAPQAPIVVLTGIEDERLGLDAVRHGVQDYLVKGRADGPQIARAIRYAIERQQADQALRESEQRLKRAQQIADVGSWEWDIPSGTLLWSEQVYRQIGEDPASFTPNHEAFRRRIHPEDRAAFDTAVDRALASASSYDLEVRVIRSDMTIRVLHTRGEVLAGADGQPRRMVGVCLDITGRKQAEQALRRAKEEWERTFDSVPDLVAIMDDKHRILRANRAMAERLGCTPEQCIGEVCYKSVHGTTAPPASCPHVQTLADGQGHVAEIHEERLGGDFLVSTTPLLDDRGERVGAVHVARDITTRKHAEEALRQAHEQLERRVAERTAELQAASEGLKRAMAEQRRLEAEILEAGNRERQRIGQDLHDGLTQQLSGIKYLGETLHEKLAQHISIKPAELARMMELLGDAVGQARALAHGLNPVEVEPNGLMLALERFAGTVRETFKIGCRLECRPPVPVEDNVVATHLYRIAQEAVQNAIKHGKAARVTMRLRDADNLITLEVRDNGVGLTKVLKSHPGIGLHIMQYRARACGGSLFLRQGPRGGMWVICSVPHPAASKKRTAT